MFQVNEVPFQTSQGKIPPKINYLHTESLKKKKIQIAILQWKRISLKYTEQHFIAA